MGFKFFYGEYLSQIKSNLYKTVRETSCGGPKMIKTKTTKNPQTNKQENKQLNILDPKYICQIKSDLHKTFWKTSCGCSMIIEQKTNKSIIKEANEQTNKK